jgi:hypothetical protein
MKDGAPDAGMHTDKLFPTKQSWEEKGVLPSGSGARLEDVFSTVGSL